ncbi:MAG: sigma 54-interacting transcriptional regulator [Myxococcaceae bacterium]
MSRLEVRQPSGASTRIELTRALHSVGSAPDNDIVLEDTSLPATVLHLEATGAGYQAVSHVGKFRVADRTLSRRLLEEGDVITLGACTLTYVTSTDTPQTGTGESAQDAREALHRLTALAEFALQSPTLDLVLERLLDEALALTQADHGSLLLLDNGVPRVHVSRGTGSAHSDSIVEKVVASRKPVRIGDAMEDPEFRAAESVVNLKLLSVLCVPLTYRSESFGALWLGNRSLTHRFGDVDLELLTIFAAQASLLVQNARLLNELKLESSRLRQRLEAERYGDLIGASTSMREVYRRIDKLAGTDLSVLISGETGTGKELIARELHRRSPRAKAPFVSINCGAIPENLLESELFGHVRGAFTGAVSHRIGRFQAANGGTLFLDEIGELPMVLQVKLLRALEERVVYRVGDTRPEPVDIRVLAATNRKLDEEVRSGRFREDLYYRLNVVSVTLPPLRERGEDVLLMATFFLHRHAETYASEVKGFGPAAVRAITRHAWPGNVRELENRIKKAVVLAEQPLLSPEDLDLSPAALGPTVPLAQAKEAFQQRYINEVLERNGGNRTKTARDLGVDPRTIFRHLERRDADDDGAESSQTPEGTGDP